MTARRRASTTASRSACSGAERAGLRALADDGRPGAAAIQEDLGTSTTTVTFVLTAYLLTASVATPIIGRLGDMFGKERLLLITLICFAVGSLVCALSHSIGLLIAGRAIQGSAAPSSRSPSGSSATSSRPSGSRPGSA